MTAKPPPVPPENRSPKGTGDATPAPTVSGPRPTASGNADETGRQANIKQNTTNQGHQQDR